MSAILKGKTNVVLFLTVFGLLCESLPTESAEWTARVYQSRKKSERLKGLRLKKRVKVRGSKSGQPPEITIKGILKRKGWGIYYDGRWLVKRKSRRRKFKLRTELTGKQTELVLKAVSPKRKVKRIKIKVNFPAWSALTTGMLVEEERYEEREEEEEEQPRERKQEKRTMFMVSLGGSIVSYTETDVEDFSMTALTGKFFFKYNLEPRKWDLAFNLFGTLFPISSNRSDATVRYLGVNGRLGYTLADSGSFRFSTLLGLYYTTMTVSENAFGFKNMLGPSLTGLFNFDLANGHGIYAYGKLSLIAGLGFGNREIAAGSGYTLMLNNGHPLTFSLDFSTIDFAIDTTLITSTSTSLSVGYGF